MEGETSVIHRMHFRIAPGEGYESREASFSEDKEGHTSDDGGQDVLAAWESI